MPGEHKMVYPNMMRFRSLVEEVVVVLVVDV